MAWDTIKDNMNSFIGAFLMLLGLIFIPEIRKSKKYRVIIVILILLLCWLGYDKISRDDKLRNNNDAKIDSLNRNVKDILTKAERDSTLNANRDELDKEFQEKLLKDFKIFRDSANNKPILVDKYTTNIEKARDVFIGREN